MRKKLIKANIVLILLGLFLTVSSCTNLFKDNQPSKGSEPNATKTPEELPDDTTIRLQYDDYRFYGKSKTITSANQNIVEITSDNQIHAVGIGNTTITIDSKEYSVEVQKAKLAVFLCIGQSNMTVISTGNEGLAIKPAEGTAYWNSLSDSTSLSQNGVKGLFGAFADMYYKTSGEKCLMIQAAAGGSSINSWQGNSGDLGNAISKYNSCADTLNDYTDYYEITRSGCLWLQGETDCRIGMSAKEYSRLFCRMKGTLNTYCDKIVDGSDKAFSFIGVLSVRSWSGRSGYERPLNIVFTGPRAAQYAMCHSDSIEIDGKEYDTSDVYLISNITEQWYSDESVAAYFSSDKLYYSQDAGVVKMVAKKETDEDALMPPDISSASNTSYPDQHYLQKGYNEMGADAGKNLANILKTKQGIQTEKAEYDVVLRDFNGIISYKNGDKVTINHNSILVPCVTNLSATNYCLSYEFTSKDCPNAYVDSYGQIIGLTDKASGEYKVYLNNSSKPVLTVTVTLDYPTIGLPDLPIEEGSYVYLSDLIDTKKCTYWRVNMADSSTANPSRKPGKDNNYNASGLTVADVPYEKGIGLHPQQSKDAEIIFDIKEYGCNKFYAIVGSPGLSQYGNGVICKVYVDDGDGTYKLLEKSGVLRGKTVHVFDLDITGAEKIKLVVNHNGDYTSDSTTWAYSIIYKESK